MWIVLTSPIEHQLHIVVRTGKSRNKASNILPPIYVLYTIQETKTLNLKLDMNDKKKLHSLRLEGSAKKGYISYIYIKYMIKRVSIKVLIHVYIDTHEI